MNDSLFNFADQRIAGKDEWLTPPEIIHALGPFDLDPCAPVNPPWPLAKHCFTCHDNGLSKVWDEYGRVWCNPPYSGVGKWLGRMAAHNNGIALVFARTETKFFQEQVWPKATGLLFIAGRLKFYHVTGMRGTEHAPAPSVLIAYGISNAERLADSKLPGAFISLKK